MNPDHTILLGFPEYRQQTANLAEKSGLPWKCIDIHDFPDGESRLTLPASLPAHVILCRSLDHPNARLTELLLAAGGARQGGAATVSLVAPYLCYMRQDKAFHPGEVVSQKVIGRLLAGAFDNLLTVDAHLHRVRHLQDAVPVRCAINVTATDPMAHFIRQHVVDPFLLGPDAESEQWVRAIAAHDEMDFGVARKQRLGDRQVKIHLPEAAFFGRNIVLVDDVASTGRTLYETARALQPHSPASISVLVTHALFVGDALAMLQQAGVSNIWSCDAVPHASNVVSLASLLAQNMETWPAAVATL